MTPVSPEGRAALEAALAACPAHETMFLTANLRDHGLRAADAEGRHPNATAFWGAGGFALGLTRRGMLLPAGGPLPPAGALAAALRGRTVTGAAGPAALVRPLLATLGLAGRPATLDDDEPQFLLDLADLRVPDGPGTLVPAAAHAEIALDWRHAYETELHPPATRWEGAGRPDWIEDDAFRLLVEDDRPLAMTGLNARLPDIVQVGGVYTPPAARGRGLARRAVALHLAQQRAAGVARATLFAASEAAVACYRPLGFRPIGTFALILWAAPAEVAPCAAP